MGTDHDDQDSSESRETMAFNGVIDMKDTSLHVEDSASNDKSLFSDEEKPYEELQEKYNMMYAKWIDLVAITLKKDLQDIQKQNEAPKPRNYALIAQVKDVTRRF